MKKAGLVLNGLLVVGIAAAVLIGSEGRATAVVPTANPTLAALETETAKAPTAANLAALSKAYLDCGQPGLAQSVLDRHSALKTPDLSHSRARVAIAQGNASEALTLSKLTLAQCEENEAACSSWLVAKSLHQVEFLEAVLDAGIDDLAANPNKTSTAMFRSSREVRLAQTP